MAFPYSRIRSSGERTLVKSFWRQFKTAFHVLADRNPLNQVVGPAFAVQPLRAVTPSSALRESSKVPLGHFLPVDGDRDLDPREAVHIGKRPLDAELLLAELRIGDDVFLGPGRRVEPIERFGRSMSLSSVVPARGGVTARERRQEKCENESPHTRGQRA